MADHKRSPISVDQASITSLAQKRHKPDLSISTKVSFFLSVSFFNSFNISKTELVRCKYN